MGWGTNFVYEEYISRRVFGSKGEIEDAIEELENDINEYEISFIARAVADPTIIPDPEDERSTVTSIQYRMMEDFEYYRQSIITLHKLRMFLEVTTLN